MGSQKTQIQPSDRRPSKDSIIDEARRDAIRRVGKYAAYTAPALLAMLTGKAYAQSSEE